MKAFLLAWFLLIGGFVLAQKPHPDVIHKTNKTTINAKVDELTDTDIIYFEPAAPKIKKTVARSQVWKIVFGDGSTEIITRPAVETAGASTPGVSAPGMSQSGTDQITLLDQTIVLGKVTRRDERKLYYTKPNDPSNTQYEMMLTRLDRIRYADGREEVLRKGVGSTSPAPVAQPTATPITSAPPTPDARPAERGSSANYTAPDASAATYTNPKAFGRIHLTVGPEFSYYPAQLNQDRAWLNDSTGFGMKQNVGASLRFDYRFVRPLAVSITAGYFGWELVRNYTRDGFSEYTETKRLTQVPVQIGLKLYPFGGLYLMPEGGVNLLFSSIKTSDFHPMPTDESVRSTPITYGGSLGYEIRGKVLLLDLSVRYQLLNISNLRYANVQQALNEQVSIATVRLGIGFTSAKK